MIGAFVTGFGFCTGGRRVAVVELCAAAAAAAVVVDAVDAVVVVVVVAAAGRRARVVVREACADGAPWFPVCRVAVVVVVEAVVVVVAAVVGRRVEAKVDAWRALPGSEAGPPDAVPDGFGAGLGT